MSTCASAVGANYEIRYAPGAVVITRSPLVVTVGDVLRLVGQPDPAFQYTVAGLVGDDTVAALTGSPSYVTPATSTSAAGTYPVTVSGLAAANYAVAFEPGTLTIARAPVRPSPGATTATVERDGDAGGDGDGDGSLGASSGADGGSASEVSPPAVESDSGAAPAADGAGTPTAENGGDTATATATATGAPWPLILGGLALVVVAAGSATAVVRRPRS
ncbi:MAG: hypothetical protein HGA44_17580 [Cellulomonadaceae bacterium]|nr:hypothetical protein [Cellulomonadaceae bacterium]